jgi:hypothetical protein
METNYDDKNDLNEPTNVTPDPKFSDPKTFQTVEAVKSITIIIMPPIFTFGMKLSSLYII